jgi:nucleotide-binding universal stress UspA family protein
VSRDPIIVGTDGSPTANLAVDKAGELAKALGAPVHVVCVPAALAGHDAPGTAAQEIVAEAGDRLQGRGITVQTHVPEGDAAPALDAIAEQEHARMIVVGNKGMTGIFRTLGSVPNRVSHHARSSVLIARTKSPSPAEFGHGAIVVGTNGSRDAMHAVREAIRLAKALESELHIVSVHKPATTMYVPPCSPEDAIAAAVAEAADEGVNATTHLTREEPVAALLRAAKESDAAIIVIAHTGTSGDEKVLGNLPDALSHKGAASVLIVSGAGGSESDRHAISGEMVASGKDAAG